MTRYHRRNREFKALQVSGQYPNLTWLEFRHPAQALAYLQMLEKTRAS